jgi:hypothetical protein
MRNTKTYFEQIPVAVVKKIAEEDIHADPLDEKRLAVPAIPARRPKLLSWPALRNRGHRKGL